MSQTTEERIKELEARLMQLGFSGLAYTLIWNSTAKELERLKDDKR